VLGEIARERNCQKPAVQQTTKEQELLTADAASVFHKQLTSYNHGCSPMRAPGAVVFC